MNQTGTGPAVTTARPGRTDLGRRVAARRQDLGFTREELGRRCGADATYIDYVEEHAAAPALASLVRLADALGTTVAELTGVRTEYPPGRATAALDAELIPLPEEECRQLLSTHGIGRIAVFTPNGPAIVPVNYTVDEETVAFRTSDDAVLARAAGAEAAFEVDRIDEVTRRGWSVLAVGELAAVTNTHELQRFDALARSEPWAGGERTHWMKVTPTRVTGRRVVNR
ncbi:pyridoxamine 5'-phosphate oxidase family protein [Streptomyces sp. H27-H1]|uniref:helix-turn-helix domain-containing protein n=1 Tax=Streptomyces sp. H27-H1 TaxID=2996461 RepID=UPI0022722282|nr:pyridoxamine 5'-phosphate oxidase family protein [Streptomyces sp. H27-H1]MCY0927993.1 pyridoxamine 5'-phosphate oxidase family protein [Streptomyces sp. H27-H1]